MRYRPYVIRVWHRPSLVPSSSEDQHGKCVHARDAIFVISNCKNCENFTLKTLRARLAVFDRESAVLPCRAILGASFLREAVAWSSEAELEAMESEQFSLSLPPSPGHHHINSPVQFSHGCLALSPEARDTLSFGLEDILYKREPPTLRNSGLWTRELVNSGLWTELVEVLAHATEKLSLDWPDESRKSQSSKLDERFLSGSGSRHSEAALHPWPATRGFLSPH